LVGGNNGSSKAPAFSLKNLLGGGNQNKKLTFG